jgi:ribonuclease P protein component
MHLSRLRGRKNNERLQRQGMLWKGKHLWMRFAPGAPRHPAIDPTKPGIYVGAVTSAKLDKSAVKRNRMRRRCREGLRVLVKEQPDFGPLQLLIIPRSSSLSAPFSEISQDLRAFLSHVHGRRSQAR